jgi:hypothetical protein
MTTPTHAWLAALAAGTLLLPLAGAAAVTEHPISAKGQVYEQPKAGSWKHKDPFGDAAGTLKVKPAKGAKPPKVAKLQFTVLQQDNGYMCPAPGAVLKVKGSFPLRKAPKWSDDYFKQKFAWISAKKDKKYDADYPNQLGMKSVKVSVKIGAETRAGLLAVSFVKDKPRKAHELELSMRLLAPGANDPGEGWCLFSASGKPGK